MSMEWGRMFNEDVLGGAHHIQDTPFRATNTNTKYPVDVNTACLPE